LRPEDFFAAAFRFVPAFLVGPRFVPPFFGIRAPDCRASLNAIATACLRFVTFFFPPDFNWPRLYSPITFPTLPRPFVEELRFFEAPPLFEAEAEDEDDFRLVAIDSPFPEV
jgi:hypothetical protein